MPPEITPTPQPKPPKQPSSLPRLLHRANSLSGVIALLVAVLIAGSVIGYFISPARKNVTAPQTIIQNLSASDIQKLTDLGANLGSTNQILTIAANTVFRSKVDVGTDLTVTGRFNANGPVTLSQLNITGTTALSGLDVGSNLTVAGVTTLQKGLTITGLAAVNGGLNVSGSASVNSLNATSISTQNISISGPITIGHLITKGPTPGISPGSVGGGGTVSISGNDTAGTIDINTGSSPSSDSLANITFRAAFSGAPRVILTATSFDSAAAQVYVTAASTGFAIHIRNYLPGQIYSFDYIVTQ
jgi:hypothetical protein